MALVANNAEELVACQRERLEWPPAAGPAREAVGG